MGGPTELLASLRAHDVSQRVIDAVLGVPRDRFVPRDLAGHAWEDRPLPIGFGQTISQPSLIALILDVLRVGPGAKALDVGTGSGYQAALVARLGAEVVGVERIPELARRAAATFTGLGLHIPVRCGDGSRGWPQHAPFDVIIVAAAADAVPPALVDQLVEPGPGRRGGRLVLPLREDPPRATQQLALIERTPSGLERHDLMPVSYVPLVVGD